MLKSKLFIPFFSLLLLIGFQQKIFSYDKRTHKEITGRGIFENKKLGVDKKIKEILKDEWNFEKGENQTFSFRMKLIYKKSGNYRQLITRGSWEEDVPEVNCPKHFYDPTKGNGLKKIITFTDAMSRGVDGVGFTDWSYKDSKNYLYDALTAKKEKDRLANFGRMFYSLGRTIHLLEDMAVPAHVRNDAHIYLRGAEWLLRDRDLYEHWAEENAKKLKTSGYDAVTFSNNDVKDLWDEKRPPEYDENPGANIGMGLAEFTNHNFLSRSTNLDDKYNAYLYPVNYIGLYSWKEPYEFEDKDGVVRNVDVVYARSKIKDVYKPAQSLDSFNYLTAYSYWDFELNKAVGKRAFTLNNKCHEEYAKLLIPRAVGYSAGLLNHFFRGKLDVTKKEALRKSDTDRQYDITLKIKNNSDETMTGGSFVLMYKKSDTKYAELGRVNLSAILDSGQTLAPGAETKEWKINDVEILMPAYAKDEFGQDDFRKIEFTLAYKGQLGEEQNVTIGKVFGLTRPFVERWDTAVIGSYPAHGGYRIDADDKGDDWDVWHGGEVIEISKVEITSDRKLRGTLINAFEGCWLVTKCDLAIEVTGDLKLRFKGCDSGNADIGSWGQQAEIRVCLKKGPWIYASISYIWGGEENEVKSNDKIYLGSFSSERSIERNIIEDAVMLGWITGFEEWWEDYLAEWKAQHPDWEEDDLPREEDGHSIWKEHIFPDWGVVKIYFLGISSLWVETFWAWVDDIEIR